MTTVIKIPDDNKKKKKMERGINVRKLLVQVAILHLADYFQLFCFRRVEHIGSIRTKI